MLDVEHIREGSQHLGLSVTVREVQDGLHDLVLSRSEVRTQVLAEVFRWLEAHAQPMAADVDAG